jgi:hypothetical protein
MQTMLTTKTNFDKAALNFFHLVNCITYCLNKAAAAARRTGWQELADFVSKYGTRHDV